MKTTLAFPHLARWTGALFLVALLSALAARGLAAPAGQIGVESGGLTLDGRAGFDGMCKDQRWIPLRITLENSGPAIDGQVLISAPSYGSDSTLYTYPLQLASTARKELRLAIYPETYINELNVRLRVDGNILLAQKVPVRCLALDQPLVGVLAGNPSALNSLAEYPAGARDASLARLEPADIPEHAQYLESLDVLLVSDLDTGALRPAQVTAIEGWLASGGQLLVMGGAGWQKSTAGLAGLLPLQPESLDEAADLSPLAGLAGVAAAQESPSLARSGLLASGALTPGSVALLRQGEQIWAASRPVGFGRALYFAFDLASEPLRSWDGAPQLLAALLEPAPAVPGWAHGFVDSYQAGSALSTLPSLRLVGVGWLLGFLITYVLAIGPLNYLLLRVLKRRELAWVTIPLLALVFAGGAFLVGGRSRGSLPVLSRLAVVQVWPGHSEARLDGLLGVFSPARQSYAISLAPGLTIHPLRDSNLQPPTGGYDLSIAEDGSLSMPAVRLDVAALLGQAVGGMLPAPQFDQQLSLTVDANSARLAGKITNQTNIRLENVVLLTSGWSQALGDLNPGAELLLDVDLQNATWSNAATVPGKGTPAVYYSYPTGTPSLDILIGGTNYYQNPALFRRFSLLSAAAGYNVDLGQSGGFYLAGWSSQPAFEASVDRRFDTDDLTLYLIALQPELASQGTQLTLPPAFFRWSLPPGSANYGPDRTPYSGYLAASDPFFFDYQLIQPVEYTRVSQLTLHLNGARLDGGDNTTVLLDVSLWDFTRSAWTALDALPFGDHTMPTPERFVGPGGTIRLRLANPDDLVPVQLQGVDFSLQVQRSAP